MRLTALLSHRIPAQRSRPSVVAVLVMATGLAGPLGGCARTILTADDCIVEAGQPGELVAYVDKQLFVVFTGGLEGEEVQFYIDDEKVGQALTDDSGRARIMLRPGVTATHFTVRTRGDTRNIAATASFYEWDPDRTAVAVDLDETISHTQYSNLIWGDGMISRPVKGSVDGLHGVAKNYHVLYYSARPRFMLERTRKWLDKHGFPPGPIVFASNWTATLRQAGAKKELLADLRQRWPNVRVGIGDKHADVECCIANNMLPVIVNGARPSFRKNAVVVAGWGSVEKFFTDNQTALGNEQLIGEFITDKTASMPAGFIPPPPDEVEPTAVAAAGTIASSK